MRIMVNGEIKNLECVINGIDCADDVVGNNTYLSYTDIAGDKIAEMDEELFNFWAEYLENFKNDEIKRAELIAQYGDVVNEIIIDHITGLELSDQHSAFLRAVKEIENL